MKALIHKTQLQKPYKWGMDIYTFNGKNIIGWRGFKNFFSVWFHNSVFLKDPYKVLVNASEGKTKFLRQWRFTDSSQFDEKKVLEYIEESIQTIKDGKILPRDKNNTIDAQGICLATVS